MSHWSFLLHHLLDCPGQSRAQALAEHRSTGFADGHQPMERPFTRTTQPQLTHQETVRQHDQVHVPCLALDITQLTIPEAELLLAVPMEGLRTCPAIPIHS